MTIGDQPARRDVALLGQGIAFQPHFADRGQLAAVPDLVQSGGLPPGIHPGRGKPGRKDGRELLLGVFKFSVRLEQFDEFLAQFRQDLDVEGRVAQPGLGQRAGGPVGGGMFLGQSESEQLLDDCREAYPRQSRQPGSQFRIEQFVRPHAQLRKAGKVLARCVQDPFDAVQGIVDDLQVPEGFRVDEPRTRTLAPDLDQEGPLSVAEAGGALRVHPGRARPGGDGGRAAFQAGLGFQ